MRLLLPLPLPLPLPLLFIILATSAALLLSIVDPSRLAGAQPRHISTHPFFNTHSTHSLTHSPRLPPFLCVSLSTASTAVTATAATSASTHSTPTAMSCNDFAHITRQPRQSDEHYRTQLTPQQFYCSRQAGTERPGTGPLLHNKQKGTYTCVSCSSPLFDSSTKFESGTGWPSFYDKLGDNVKEKVDISHGMRRVEVLCAACDGHLGHVFDDGPSDKTGLRYCINSASLGFVAAEAGGNETEIVDHDNVCAVPSKK